MRRIPLSLLLLVPALAQPQVAPAGLQPLAGLRSVTESYLRRHFTPADGRLELHVDAPDPRLRLAACAGAPAASLPGDRLIGSRINVALHCAGPVPWTIYLPADVHVYRPVLVATTALARGEEIAPEDVRAALRDTSLLGYGYLDSTAQLAGRRLLRPVAPGAALEPGMFAPRLLIHAGDPVSLLAVDGAVRVRSRGIALAGGGAGTRIAVRNDSSGRILQAIVEAAGQVRVLP